MAGVNAAARTHRGALAIAQVALTSPTLDPAVSLSSGLGSVAEIPLPQTGPVRLTGRNDAGE